ncbi:MAG: leucine-rich repeat domain-containing protein [Mariniblastus sp.]
MNDEKSNDDLNTRSIQPKKKTGRLRFSLRSFFILAIIISMALGFWGERWQRQGAVVAHLESRNLEYSYEPMDPKNSSFLGSLKKMCAGLLGNDFVYSLVKAKAELPKDLDEIAKVTWIEELDVSEKRLTDEELDAMRDDDLRYEAYLAEQDAIKWDLNKIAKLTGIKRLTLTGKTTDLSFLDNLNKLEYLDCYSSRIASGVEAIRGKVNLEAVTLRNFEIRDLSVFAESPQLRVLMLNGKDIESLGPLKACPKLERVKINAQRGMDEPLGAIKDYEALLSLSKLVQLDIGGSDFSDLNLVVHMPLSSLDISNTKVVDLSPLKDSKSLTVINLTACKIDDYSPLTTIPTLRLIISQLESEETKSLQDLLPNCRIY